MGSDPICLFLYLLVAWNSSLTHPVSAVKEVFSDKVCVFDQM